MPKDFDLKYPFYTVRGPFATIRVCDICGHAEKVATGRPGVGRGYGLREGNKARGRMIQHIKDAHKTAMIGLYGGRKKVGEIDVSGWTVAEVVELMRAVRLNGRRAKYYSL